VLAERSIVSRLFPHSWEIGAAPLSRIPSKLSMAVPPAALNSPRRSDRPRFRRAFHQVHTHSKLGPNMTISDVPL
jgi:hypothetical protein